MSLLASKLLSIGSAGTVAVASTAGGVVIYQKRDKIFYSSNSKPQVNEQSSLPGSSSLTEDLTDVLYETEVSSENIDAKGNKTKDNDQNSSSSLDSGDLQFLIAKFTAETNNPDTQKTLFDTGKTTKKYDCQFENVSNTKFNNPKCQIYKLSSQVQTKKALVDISEAVETSQIKDKAELKTNDHYIVKLSSTFLKQFGYDNKYELKIVSIEQPTYTFGKFTNFIDINKPKQLVNNNIVQSNLFIAEVTKASTESGTLDYSANYKCNIGSENPIPCKIYKVEKTNGEFTKAELDTVTNIGTLTSDLTVGKYIIVDLLDNHKTLSQLEGKLEVFKVVGSTATSIVTAVADQLIIGALDATAKTSDLYIPKNTRGALTTATVTEENKKSHIITKVTAEAEHLKATRYTSSDYICRVKNATQKLDDDDCKLFPLFITSKTHFDLEDYKGATNNINQHSDLNVGKRQVIELKKSLRDKLDDSTWSLHLVKKTRKEQLINNQVIDLSKVFVLNEDDQESPLSLKTNLFLFRYKGNKPSEAATIAAADSLTCSISGESSPTAVNCKIYKFNPSSKENSLTSEKIKKLQNITTTNAFAVPFHFVIEFDATNKKTAEQLKNKTITLKKGEDTLGDFVFDSLIFGIPKVAGQQLPRKEVTYLVEKNNPTATWSDLSNATSYRCKLPAPTETTSPATEDNFDFECKLIKITPTSPTTITTTAEIKKLTDKLEASSLNNNADRFFKLVFDERAFYNFPTDLKTLKTEALIDLEILVNPADESTKGTTSKQTKYIKKLKVKEKLSETTTPSTLVGKARIVLAEIKEDVTESTDTFTTPKCAYSATAEEKAKFTCQIYPVTANPDAAINASTNMDKFTPTFTEVNSETSFVKGKLFLIKLNAAKKFSELPTDKIIHYHYLPTTTSSEGTTSTAKKVQLTINGYLEGTLAANKQLFFIADPVASA